MHFQKYWLRYAIAVIATLFTIYAVIVTVVPPWKPRPLFHNTWGVSDKGGFIPEWQPDGIIYSQGGLLVLADFEVNQIVAIDPPVAKVTLDYFQFDENRASIRFQDEQVILIPKSFDMGIVIDRTHAIRRFPIRRGSTKQLYRDSFTMKRDDFIAMMETFRAQPP